MSKYAWLFVFSLGAIIITIIAQQVETITIMNSLDGGVSGEVAITAKGITGFFQTYWNLLSFNVVGLPAFVSLLFIPVNLVIGVIVGEMGIKLLEAIIPW